MIKLNSLIKVVDDKLIVSSTDREFFVSDVNFIEIIAFPYWISRVVGVIAGLMVFIVSFFVTPIMLFGFNLIVFMAIVIIGFAFLLENRVYAIQIISCHAEKEVVSIAKKDISEANKFIKAFFNYKWSNPKFQIPSNF